MPAPNSESPLVFLTTAEVRCVYEVANGYYSYGHNPNAEELGTSSMRACMIGAMGELAACKFYGIDYEPVFEPDEGYDIRIGDWTANVKASPYFEDPWLRVMDKLNKNCDAYILVAVNFTSALVKMIGWARQEEVADAPLRKLANGLPACRVLYPEELRPCRKP